MLIFTINSKKHLIVKPLRLNVLTEPSLLNTVAHHKDKNSNKSPNQTLRKSCSLKNVHKFDSLCPIYSSKISKKTALCKRKRGFLC